MRIGSQFSDNEKDLVLQVVRQSNSAELQAAYPSGYVFGLHGVEHVAELFFLLGRIGVAGGGGVFVMIRKKTWRSGEKRERRVTEGGLV